MTQIIAHRGLSAIAPENTLSSFQPLMNYDVAWLESDVAITADGQLVIIHDDHLDRTTNLSGEVSQSTYADIAHADTGSWFDNQFAGNRLLTITDLINLVNMQQLNLNLEIKGISGANGSALVDQLIDNLLPELARLDPNLQLVISSFNPIILLKMAQAAPHLTYGVLYDKGAFYPDWQILVDAVGATRVHIDNADATPENIAMIQARGFEVYVYTVNDHARAQELTAFGIDGIFTDIAHQFLAPKVNSSAEVV